jgi:alcohol dehydrogenase class IV
MAAAPGSPAGHFRGTPQQVIFGIGSIAQLPVALRKLGVSHGLIITGRTVGSSPLVDAVRKAAPDHPMDVFAGAEQHAPRESARRGAQAAREAGTDFLISLGGSSPVDVAKGVALLLGEGKDFDDIQQRGKEEPTKTVPLICITTTLSQSEFSNVTGITNEATGEKQLYFDDGIMARYVFLDADTTVDTPERLWLSTGVKALDTTIDIYLQFTEPQPFWDPMLLQAAADLGSLLSKSKAHPSDRDTRQRLQVAAWMGEFPRFHLPIDTSVSSGRGWLGSAARHQLGGHFGLPHGEIAGVLLRHSLAFHADETEQKQLRLAEVLGESSLEGLYQRIQALVRGLGLPTRLRDMGVQKEQVAASATTIVSEQPRLGSESAVAEHLQRAW